jgi:transposase
MSNLGTATDKMVCRRLAVELLEDGKTLADVAERLGVSQSSVKRWKKAFRQGGLAALAPKRHPGPKSKLSASQKVQLRKILVRGARAAGFATDLWTCPRVAQVVERTFGVSYHPDHLGRILHDMGFSPQKPLRRARERDESAIARWRKRDWPRIKKRAGDCKLASFFSTRLAFFCNRSIAARGPCAAAGRDNTPGNVTIG